MKIQNNEMLLVYNSNDPQDREGLGYAKSLPKIKIKEFDVTKNMFTETQLKQIAERLELKPVEMINKQSESYQTKFADVDLNEKEILKILKKHPSMLKTPIAIYRDEAHFINSSFNFIQKRMKAK